MKFYKVTILIVGTYLLIYIYSEINIFEQFDFTTNLKHL